MSNFGISLFLIFSILISSNAYSDQSAEDIIKERKALFSKNYKTAKRVQALSAKGEFDQAKELMIEMSFKTGSLPIIWEEKENFNTLMQKSSDDMIKLTSIIETVGDVNIPIRELMWGNCKACHSKYREEH